MSTHLNNETDHWPKVISSEAELDEILTRPSEALTAWVRHIPGPLVVLGASGKMGPSLCVLVRRAADRAGHPLDIVAVSRFSDRTSQAWLEQRGVKTIACDLLDRRSYQRLPEANRVIYLVGMKFGTQDTPWQTWAVNTLVPAYTTERYREARMVALSTGNVYPFMPAPGPGASETCPPGPIGEYANAALARERIFEYASRCQKIPLAILRLNYAVELRYGVLVEIAQKVWKGEAIDVNMGYVNCLWQKDANEMILRSLDLAESPPAVWNLTGPTALSVRDLADRFGVLMQRPARIAGTEASTALLSNSSQLAAKLGPPTTSLDEVLAWTAAWIMKGHKTLAKATHFQERSGRY